MRSRIKQARLSAGLSQKALAEKIGISDAALSKIESGINNPAPQTIIALCAVLGISRQWLETGEGEMYGARSSRALDVVTERYNGSPTFRAVLDVYASLSAADQDALERYIEQLSQAVASGQRPETVRPQTVGEYLNGLGVDTQGAEPAKESSQSDQHSG